MYFGVRRSMLLYKPLMTLVQAVIISGSLTPIRDTFNLGFKDFIKQLIKADLFYPVSLV